MNESELVITIQALPDSLPPYCIYGFTPCLNKARWLVNDSDDVVDVADPLCDAHVGIAVTRRIDEEAHRG